MRLLNVEVEHARSQLLRSAMPTLSQPFARRSVGYAALARNLEAELGCGDDASVLALESLFIESLLNSSCDWIFAKPGRPAWLDRVIDLLHSAPAGRHTMDSIAKEAGVHPVHVARTFRKRYGCTVGAYLRTLRMRMACRALKATHTPLAAIAHQAGFADQSHFNRVFHKVTGMSPGAYRVAAAHRTARPREVAFVQ